MGIKRTIRISAAVALAAVAVLVGVQQGHVTSHYVAADTTWAVPADTTWAVAKDTAWAAPAGATVGGGEAKQDDTTW